MTIDIKLPTSWQELTDKQLCYVCSLLAAEAYTPLELKTYCLVRFAGLQCDGEEGKKCHRYIHAGRTVVISDADMAAATAALDWLETPPAVPVRPERMAGGEPVNAELHGVPVSTYLMAENLWQSYVMIKNAGILDELAKLLIPECRTPLMPYERIAMGLWYSGIKQMFADAFPDLFQPGGGNGNETSPNELREMMDAQIRALTGGDITKEQTVLAADTWRALTELNAKARESKELNSKMK